VDHLVLCNPGLADVLGEELSGLGLQTQRSDVLEPPFFIDGIVPCRPLKGRRPAFARQYLPAALQAEGDDLQGLSGALLGELPPEVVGHLQSGPHLLQVFTPENFRRGSAPALSHPLESLAQDLRERLLVRAEGRARKREAIPDAGPAQHVQVLVVGAFKAWLAWGPRSPPDPLLGWPSPLEGGRFVVRPDSQAPSSAHRKAEEALFFLNRSPGPGDLVLDLGAAPGGWAWVALRAGARVIAVDRGRMDPGLLEEPNLEHHKTDAFAYEPTEPVHWLFCDVIGDANRVLDLVQAHLQKGALKGAVITLKTPRPVDFAVIDRARAMLGSAAEYEGLVGNLFANKCEVTIMARRVGSN
jgi:23S rRNA (cytidine2498-2'-O)-methyltransferase